MRPARTQMTTRSIAAAMFWFGVCMALWTSGRAFEAGYPVLLGWLALCLAAASLLGVALKFVRAVAISLPLLVAGVLLVAALTWIIPPGPAIPIVGGVVWIVVRAWRARSRNRTATWHVPGLARRGSAIEQSVE